jgi:hypothetical protein
VTIMANKMSRSAPDIPSAGELADAERRELG